jgi:hypothetical protein
MSTGVMGPGRARVQAKTLRQDRWWLAPLATFVVFSAFVVYATWRAFSGSNYYSAPYLSPFYSPCLTDDCVAGSSDFGHPFSWWQLSPALLILIFPLGFRMTCYYYRKAYYRAFWLSPPACAVAEPHKTYSGETRFPLIFQNAHRYFFYAAVAISLINTYDAILAFHSPDGFGFGLGNIVLLVNVVMLWAYTASCHSCRSIVGGRLKHFSGHPVRYRSWTVVSRLNTRHMELAWITLGTLAFTDFYVMAVSAGWISDLRFYN